MCLTVQAMPILEEKVRVQKLEVMLSMARCNSFTYPLNCLPIIWNGAENASSPHRQLFFQAVVEGLVEDLLAKVTNDHLKSFNPLQQNIHLG